MRIHKPAGAVSIRVLSTPEVRVFFGGEARDLQPLREYRAANPPVDLMLAPVNGLTIMGSKLVMESRSCSLRRVSSARRQSFRFTTPTHP